MIVEPAGIFTVWLMLAVPLVAGIVAPPVTVADQLPLTPVGQVFVVVAPVTSLGPLLLTVTVYVLAVPGAYVVTPSLIVTLRSAFLFWVSTSLAVLFVGVISFTPDGAVPVAGMVRLPVRLLAMFAVTT